MKPLYKNITITIGYIITVIFMAMALTSAYKRGGAVTVIVGIILFFVIRYTLSEILSTFKKSKDE